MPHKRHRLNAPPALGRCRGLAPHPEKRKRKS
jgi:hypothetical protein